MERSTAQRLLDAADRLLNSTDEQQPLTIEQVATAAQVSRATAYRVFGTAPAMADQVALHRLERHRSAIEKAMAGVHGALAQLEEVAVYTQIAVARDAGLHRLPIDGGIARSAVLHNESRLFLRDLVGRGQRTGEIRSDVPADELIDWLLDMTLVNTAQPVDEAEARRRFALFAVPALVPGAAQAADRQLLSRAAEHLQTAAGLLDRARGG